jgi:uncharacterized protein YndB with AHSA1/START domain
VVNDDRIKFQTKDPTDVMMQTITFQPHGTSGWHYRDISPNERIVSTEIFEGAPEAEAVVTHTFTEKGGRTTLTILMELPNREIRDTIIDSGMEAGMQESMDHLEQVARSLR